MQFLQWLIPAENFFRGWASLGFPVPKDADSGYKNGAFLNPSSLDPKDQTRSYARTAHHNRAASRPNYHLLTNTAVKSIILDGLTATGVNFIDRNSTQLGLVKATKEVILAAGTFHSPQILQLSGIGPKQHLEKLGIKTKVDLPGTGENFQDHPLIYATYKCMFPAFSIPASTSSMNL